MDCFEYFWVAWQAEDSEWEAYCKGRINDTGFDYRCRGASPTEAIREVIQQIKLRTDALTEQKKAITKVLASFSK